ncbi:MAG: DNA sulfur modification protein DndB, partial [Mobilitalea sp.]
MENNQLNVISVDKPQVGYATPSFTFPAIAYYSGQRIWYAITVPYAVLRSGLIKTSTVRKKGQEVINSEVRNRFLDKVHKDDIKSYITEEDKYTIPPITLVSTERLPFEPFIFGTIEKTISTDEFYEILKVTGSLAGMIQLPLDYQFECLDGNHRVAAIQELVDETPQITQGSNILLNVVLEKNKNKIRQDFVDVNKNARQTTPSINTLFNTRDAVPNIVSKVMEEIEYLEALVDMIITSISKNSNQVYTLNNIKNVVVELAGYDAQSGKSAEEKANKLLKEDEAKKIQVLNRTLAFFNALKNNEYINQCMINHHAVKEIRPISVLTVGIGLSLAASIANYIFSNFQGEDQNQQLIKLMQFDWSRSNQLFLETGLVGEGGAIANTRAIVINTKVALLKSLGFAENKDEVELIL